MRCFVIDYRKGNKATFECQMGHVFRRGLVERGNPPQEMLTRLADGWRKPQGIRMDCPRCEPIGWRSGWWRQ